MKRECLLAACLVLAAVATPGLAASNETPLADAGLDQTVTRGTTVYLDAGGSQDPDGGIERYRWTIASESGDATGATTPQCQRCQRTQFTARGIGTYRVTLEVTDGDGASATDALFVTVEPGDGPTASLAAPAQTTPGEPAKVTLDVDAGSAPLDRIVWSVDGEPVETESASGDATTSSRPTRFPTTGPHEVSVAVVDKDGQRDAASEPISVVDPAETETQTTYGGSSGAGDAEVVGPQVVTGHGEPTAEYELSTDASGTWMQDDERVDTGSQTTRSFTAGIHELYAATDAGVATFPDGSRTVVADPAPELTSVEVEDASVVPVTIEATDRYENLNTVTLHVDGEPVETRTTERVGSRIDGDSLNTKLHLPELSPGNHTITVRARDTRGQTDVAVRYVEVPGPPEVVSAGFVQDGPLDPYHPRLDESRYTATYQVKVDLNGVDAERVRSTINSPQPKIKTTSREETREYLIVSWGLYIGERGEIEARSTVSWRTERTINRTKDTIRVTSAPPEIRIETIDAQTEHNRLDGMVLDASESFDPDGTEVSFLWDGTTSETERARTSMSAIGRTILEVTDQQNQTSTSTNPFEWFAPDLVAAELDEEGPFYPGEMVPISLRGERYYLTKMGRDEMMSFDVRVDEGRVTDHELVKERPGVPDDPDPEARARMHKWTVEVPAEAFLDGTLSAAAYPTAHPDQEYNITLPEPDVYLSSHSELQDVSTGVSYLVEQPGYVERSTTNRDVRDDLVDSGYEVQQVDETGRQFHLEEYVQTAPANYDVDRQRFWERGRRSFFLESNPEWTANGSTMETRTWTTTDTEWRDDRGGRGTFTGDTKWRKVADGEYRTEKQFRYETTETYETTVTYEETYTTTERRAKLQRRCDMSGCMLHRTVITDVSTHTETKTKQVTRSRTVERTYWAPGPQSPYHEYTGNRRKVTIREPEYERQYEFEVEHEHSATERVYLAEQRSLIEPAIYEWQPMATIDDRIRAETAARSPDVRISNVRPSKRWTLGKQAGTDRTRTDHVEADWTLLRKIGQGDATLVEYYVPEGDKQTPELHSRESTVSIETMFTKSTSEDEIMKSMIEELEEKYEE